MRVRLLFLAFLFVTGEVLAQTPKRVEPPKTFDLPAIDAYVASEVKARGIVGLSLAIVREGKLVFSKGYGTKVAGQDDPIQADTPFAIGSVTKQFICAGILLLAEEGKLSVDDKVSKYFPHLTRASDITLYQLMTHTSGYPDYYPLDFVDRRLVEEKWADQIIVEYAGGLLDFEPGSRWSYSNTGYLILGRVIEKVSDRYLENFLPDEIFDPLGIKGVSLKKKAKLACPRPICPSPWAIPSQPNPNSMNGSEAPEESAQRRLIWRSGISR